MFEAVKLIGHCALITFTAMMVGFLAMFVITLVLFAILLLIAICKELFRYAMDAIKFWRYNERRYMKLKELKIKYDTVELYEDREGEGLLKVPQILKTETAVERYGGRKVYFLENHDDQKLTEILIESEKQFKIRENFEN